MRTIAINNKNIRLSDLNDRDYRLYWEKRHYAAKIKQNFIRYAVLLIMIVSLTVIVMSISSKARSERNIQACKFYTTVNMSYGETIYDIALNNYDAQFYNSVEDYMLEIMQINHVSKDSPMQGGKLLYIPYFELVDVE